MFARRLIPGTAGLIAFEAAARLGSFTAAAAELNQTQGAVSRQVAQLEELLGISLFDRVRQRVVLSPAGRYFAGEVAEILGRLAGATARTIAFAGAGGTLDLAILPTFGARWLIPRMGDFFARHRDVTINFSTRVRPFDPRAEGIDAAILAAPPVAPGLIGHRFMGENLAAVAAPGLIAAQGIAHPADVTRLTLLTQETRPANWDQWFAARDVRRASDQPVLVFEQFLLVIRAAVAGLGAALVPSFLVADELTNGELAPLPGGELETGGGYHLVYPADREGYGPLVAFREWLLAVAQDADGTRK